MHPKGRTMPPNLHVDVEQETLLSVKEFCRRLSISATTFWEWTHPRRVKGKPVRPALPTILRAGRRKTSIEAYHRWLKAQNP